MNDSWPKGLKKTKNRVLVMNALQDAKIPLSALQLQEYIQKQSGQMIWLSTLYRTLELFETEGFIVKTTILNEEITLYEWNTHQHMHYAICVQCRTRIALDDCPIEALIPHLQQQSFQMIGHKIEVYGYCQKCKP